MIYHVVAVRIWEETLARLVWVLVHNYRSNLSLYLFLFFCMASTGLASFFL